MIGGMIYRQVRNAGFQSSQAVDVGQVDPDDAGYPCPETWKPLHRFLGADWAVCYKGDSCS